MATLAFVQPPHRSISWQEWSEQNSGVGANRRRRMYSCGKCNRMHGLVEHAGMRQSFSRRCCLEFPVCPPLTGLRIRSSAICSVSHMPAKRSFEAGPVPQYAETSISQPPSNILYRASCRSKTAPSRLFAWASPKWFAARESQYFATAPSLRPQQEPRPFFLCPIRFEGQTRASYASLRNQA